MSPLARATRQWLGGIISAAMSGVAGVLAMNFVDPADFNLDNPRKLLLTAAAFAIVNVVGYLQRSPLPGWRPSASDRVSRPDRFTSNPKE